MRSLLAAAACALALTSSARAQEDIIRIEDFIGVWYGENEVVPPGVRRVVPVRIEISAISNTIRLRRRFNVRLLIRCMDRPSEVCDLGTVAVQQYEGIGYQLRVRGGPYVLSPPSGACGFNMTLQSAWYDGETLHRVRKNSLEYWVTPTPRSGACNASEYSGIQGWRGHVNTTPPLNLTPSVRPEPARPPLRPPRG